MVRSRASQRVAGSRDERSLAAFDLLQQAGQFGLGFVDVHLAHELTLANRARDTSGEQFGGPDPKRVARSGWGVWGERPRSPHARRG
jgi:hypothetical protein